MAGTPVSFTSTRALGVPADSIAADSIRPPRVVVTGGSGKLGRATVIDLLEHGWEVVNFDKAPPPAQAPREAIFMRTDLEDMGQVMENLIEVDTVRKLQLIPLILVLRASVTNAVCRNIEG